MSSISSISSRIWNIQNYFEEYIQWYRDTPKNLDTGKCQFGKSTLMKNPHSHFEIDYSIKKTYENMTECIGNTPMVKINNITKDEGITCNIYVKCEFMNPFGSIKDRVALNMIKNYQKQGKCQHGDTFIEASSGNTGLSIAAVSAIFGYNSCIVMVNKISQEKRDVIQALNGQVYRVPSEAPFDSHESNLSKANDLHKQLPNSHILDQYRNPYNSLAHFDGTAEEIYYQLDGNIDYIFIAAGTGGTLSGISRKLKLKNPNIKVIAIDPEGSIFAQPQQLNEKKCFYQIEGIGYDYIPMVCDRQYTDEWIKSNDKDSFDYARKLISREGMLVGGSAGASLSSAIKYIKENNITEGNIVILAPDSIRNYLSKFINDNWMFSHQLMEAEEIVNPNNNLQEFDDIQDLELNECPFIDIDSTIEDALNQFEVEDCKIIYTIYNNQIRYISKLSIINNYLTLKLNMDNSIIKILSENTCVVQREDLTIQLAQQLINTFPIILVQDNDDIYYIDEDNLFDWFQENQVLDQLQELE